jgi:hypothetical protein
VESLPLPGWTSGVVVRWTPRTIAAEHNSHPGYTERMHRWLAVGSYLPASPTAWIIFVGLCVALVASKYAINRFFTNRHSARLDILTRESAAFVARWPPERLGYAPRGDLAAEADRCTQIVSLMRKLRTAKKADSKYFDSQIAAFQGWLATVDAAANTAATREHWTQTQRGHDPRA